MLMILALTLLFATVTMHVGMQKRDEVLMSGALLIGCLSLITLLLLIKGLH